MQLAVGGNQASSMENDDDVQKENNEEVEVNGPSDVGKENDPGKPPLSSKRKSSAASNSEPESSKSRRKSSDVWNHFTRDPNCKEGEEYANCNYCGQRFAANPKRNGTTGLRNHLLERCKKFARQDLKQTTLSFELAEKGCGVGKLKAVAFSQEEGRKKLAIMIIKDELPFKIVEGEGFLEYSKYMNSRFDMPHRTTVAKDCMKIYFDEMKKLKRSLKGQRLCFTTDTWTSIQTMNYMCLTGHWIDKNWNYQKRILNFCQIDNHRGETIGDSIEKCLVQWGIEKILTITVDNAASNDSAIRNLKSSTGYKLKSIICSHEYLHMRCCAHIFNLVVRNGLKEIKQSVAKIRKAVKYVRSSAPRLKFFGDCVKAVNIECKKGLCMDVETRWNSTYLMLDAAEKYERAFTRLERDDGRYLRYFIDPDQDRADEDEDDVDNPGSTINVIMPPNEDDWKNARCFIKFLKIFYDMTVKFSTSLSVTSNEFFHDYVYLRRVLKHHVSSRDKVLASMATKMMWKCNKYWGKFESSNGLLYIAVVLDPRYKIRYVSRALGQLYDQAQANAYTDKVDAILSHLYDQYEERYRKSLSSSVASTSSQQVGVGMEDDEVINDADDTEDLKFRDEWDKEILVDKSTETSTDLAKYLQDPVEATCANFDILSWWKVNTVKYPIMATIARDVLAIPVSTVASESAFSTGGRVLDPHRSSLKPRTVEALVCAQNWLRIKPRTSDDDDDDDPLEENKILEELEEEFEREDDD